MRKTLALTMLQSGVWGVDLPSYRMIPGTHVPVTAGVIGPDGVVPGAAAATVAGLSPRVTVELPDDTPLMPNGMIDAAGMRTMYREHPRYGALGWVPPVEYPAA